MCLHYSAIEIVLRFIIIFVLIFVLILLLLLKIYVLLNISNSNCNSIVLFYVVKSTR